MIADCTLEFGEAAGLELSLGCIIVVPVCYEDWQSDGPGSCSRMIDEGVWE